MGYMNFNNQRYFDIRDYTSVYLPLTPKQGYTLPSDSRKREDSIILRTLEYDKAQEAKVKIEEL